MPIDECKHTFLELTTTVLPAHMRRLRAAMERPVQAAIFAQTKQGPSAIANQLQLPGDFAGCYIFIEQARPIYAGISRKVLSRIGQHLCGKTHFDASLAYRMAKRKMPTQLKRGEAMQDLAFRKALMSAKAIFEDCVWLSSPLRTTWKSIFSRRSVRWSLIPGSGTPSAPTEILEDGWR